MYNGGKIIIGLIVFVGLLVFPYVYEGGKPAAKPDPKLDTPEILKLPVSERKCVESKAFMTKEHMKLLNQWRDWYVREGNRFTISLQNTCLKCHSNKTKFCDECHNYAAVTPYCWDCHFPLKEKEL